MSDPILRGGRCILRHPGTLLCLLWVAMMVLVNPIGDFPLNDDWAYGAGVKDLLEKHTVVIPPWTSASFVAQMFYGFVFCLPFGFSFTTLRLASALLGVGAVLATYGLAREAGADRKTGFVCAAALAVNPLVFQCSNTFMTDSPFLAFALLAMLFSVRALRSWSWVDGALALVAALAAVLTRQLGLLIPLALAGGLILARKFTVRRSVAVAAGGLIVFAALQLYERWLQRSGQMRPLYGMQARNLAIVIKSVLEGNTPWDEMRDRIHILLVFSGVLLAPVVAVTLPGRRRPAGWILAVAGALGAWFAVSACTNLIGRNLRMPFRSGFNLLDLGVGPLTLTDVYFHGLDHFPRATPGFWWAVTGVGIVGGALLVFQVVAFSLELLPDWRMATTLPSPAPAPAAAAAPAPRLAPTASLVFMTGYGLVMVLMFFFDRYLLPIFPMLMAIAVSGGRVQRRRKHWQRASFIAAGVALCALGAFSVAATHDYLSWNRARWTGLDHLTGALNVSPDRIDGGFEFNGRYRYGKDIGPGKVWWWVHDDEFIVTFGEMPGYETFRVYEYPRFLPPRTGNIYVLKRR